MNMEKSVLTHCLSMLRKARAATKKLLDSFNGRANFVTQIKCCQQVFASGDWTYVLRGVLLVGITAWSFYDNLFFAVFLSPYIWFYVSGKKAESHQKKLRQKTEEFKDGMLSVSFALNVGYSIENSFGEALKELGMLYGKNAAITEEFRVIVNRLKRNENLEDILDEYAGQSGIEDIKDFAAIFRYAKRSGGDLIAIIRNTALHIQEKTEVLKEIETFISGKKMEQRVMSYIPFGMIVYLRLTSPEFISNLYGNPAGIVIMSGCLLLYLLSNYLAKRIVNIEV